jgi:hypothetical protein
MRKQLRSGLSASLLLALLLSATASAAIKDFKLEAYFFQKVGETFPVYVKNAVDELGHPASGTVQIAIKGGDGLSPDSFPPILNPIVVSNGAGSAFQVLTNVAPTILEGIADTVRRTANTIFVTSGELHHFSIKLSSPQTSGQPFVAPSTLTAKDMYGNPVVNFDAAVDSVVIVASDSGQMSNNVFNTTQDFILGAADLTSKQTTYIGRGGFLTFQAQSQSGKSGLSNTVLLRSLRIESITAAPTTVRRGDTILVTVRVFNTADISGTVTNLNLNFSLGDLPFEITNANLPFTISANSAFDFVLRLIIPLDYPSGTNLISAQLGGLFNSFVVQDSFSGSVSFQVTGGITLEYVQGSLYPQIYLLDRFRPNFQVRVNYQASTYAILDTTSFISLKDTLGNPIKSYLVPAVAISPGQSYTYLRFGQKYSVVPSDLGPGKYQLSLVLRGYENGTVPFSDSMVLPDSLELRVLTPLQYVSGSLSPDSISAGKTASFSFTVNNPTDSTITILPSYSTIYFSKETQQGYFYRQVHLKTDSFYLTLSPGLHSLFSDTLTIPPDYPWGDYLFSAELLYVFTPSTYTVYRSLVTQGESLYVKPPDNLQRLIVSPFPLAQSGFISPGATLDLLKLVLKNQDPNTLHSIVLNAFTIDFGSVSAQDLFDSYSAQITSHNWTIDYPSVSGDKAVIEFPEPLILAPYQEDTVIFSATFKADANTNSFAITLDASDFQPRDFFQGQTGVPVPVTSAGGEVLSYQSPTYTLLSGSFRSSASSFPNPFNPDKEQATIIYNATPPAQVSLQLFTLTGEKVLNLENPEGMNNFKWDGRNAEGKRVLSGVYLALLKNKQTGEEVKLRIGIVR